MRSAGRRLLGFCYALVGALGALCSAALLSYIAVLPFGFKLRPERPNYYTAGLRAIFGPRDAGIWTLLGLAGIALGLALVGLGLRETRP